MGIFPSRTSPTDSADEPRLFYYPSQEQTNPIGQPIQAKVWKYASQAQGPGILTGISSDGVHRLFAFVPVCLHPEDPPYLYIWAGIPETHILGPANAILIRNLLLISLAAVISLVITWVAGRRAFIVPIQNLQRLTRAYGQGDLGARLETVPLSGEFGELTHAFHEMAAELTENQQTLRENEARFHLLMDSLDAFVYVTDMDTYEILFVNEHAEKQFGEITGTICWQTLQQGQEGPCAYCTNKYLLGEDGQPSGVYNWEFQNTQSGQWLSIHDRAIEWIDGRIVRLEVATDITERKTTEEERERLIAQLHQAFSEVRILGGLLPICASCKKIRDDSGYWNQIESYIQKHSQAEFSHGICPDCAKKLYPEFTDEDGNII